MKLILFATFLMRTYHAVKVRVSGFAGEIAKFEIDNAILADATGARINVDQFKDLVFEGIRQHNQDYQFDPRVTKLVEGGAVLARVPADDEEVSINLGKVQPKYRVYWHLGWYVEINGLILRIVIQEQLRENRVYEYELSQLENSMIISAYYAGTNNHLLRFDIDDAQAKFNERTLQALTVIKDFVKSCQEGQNQRFHCIILKALELAGVQAIGVNSDCQTSKEDEETVKGLLSAQGLLA